MRSARCTGSTVTGAGNAQVTRSMARRILVAGTAQPGTVRTTCYRSLRELRTRATRRRPGGRPNYKAECGSPSRFAPAFRGLPVTPLCSTRVFTNAGRRCDNWPARATNPTLAVDFAVARGNHKADPKSQQTDPLSDGLLTRILRHRDRAARPASLPIRADLQPPGFLRRPT